MRRSRFHPYRYNCASREMCIDAAAAAAAGTHALVCRLSVSATAHTAVGAFVRALRPPTRSIASPYPPRTPSTFRCYVSRPEFHAAVRRKCIFAVVCEPPEFPIRFACRVLLARTAFRIFHFVTTTRIFYTSLFFRVWVQFCILRVSISVTVRK